MRDIVKAFFKERSIVNHHIASYNDFIRTTTHVNSIQRIVDDTRISSEDEERGMFVLDADRTDGDKIYVRIGRETVKQGKGVAEPTIKIMRPSVKEANGSEHDLTPMEARLRNLTYWSNITLKFSIIENDLEREPEEVRIGRIPIMIKSVRCNLHEDNIDETLRNLLKNLITDEEINAMSYVDKLITLGEDPADPGGYFIMAGTERVLMTLEDLAPNRVMVEYNEKYNTRLEVAKVFSQKEGFRALTTVEKKKDGILQVSVPAATGNIPLMILMKALGMESDEEIYKSIVSDGEMANYVYANLEEIQDPKTYPPDGIKTTEQAILFLEKKFAQGQAKEYRQRKVSQIIDRSLLPHLGDTEVDRIKKAIFLGRITRTVLELALKKREPDDKDHYANKRLKLSGDLMAQLFRHSFRGLIKDLKYQLERGVARRKDFKVRSSIRPDLLQQRIAHALSTGNWVGGRAGVSQLLDRNSHMSAVSHLRRVVSPLTRSQPHFEARDLHPTQWGRLCPNETPEGQNCGLVKN
ncbi:MAG TPA: DNA-directed RNA polymerase subunit B'', partial [Euryarchaeota archaeon]|nr:DNA-directed RNA polymerase subunit B'' [Euryarchaeota archaeon]